MTQQAQRASRSRPVARVERSWPRPAGSRSTSSIVPRHVLGGAGLHRTERASQCRRESVPAAWEAATSPPSPAWEPTSSPCATSTTSVPPVRSSAFPKARRYKDFREMLDKEEKQIDAVTVGTPDHIHAVASMAAIRAGKHVYCQKPLTHTLHECRELTKAARSAGVATQMGNQGHATEGARLTNEWIQAGVIGTVQRGPRLVGPGRPALETRHRPAQRTRRPCRAHSTGTSGWARSASGPTTRLMPPSAGAAGGTSAPARWATWAATSSIIPSGHCGSGRPASSRPARPSTARSSMETSPTSRPIRSPRSSTYEFPARGDLPPVRMTWYDGGLMPPAPAELPPDERLPDNGVLYVGSKGKMYHGSHGGMPRAPPARRFTTRPPRSPKTMERSPGHYEEWVAACKGGPRPVSNFDYAGPLTEIVLLGVLALKAPGRRLEWDSENLEIKNAPELNRLVHTDYRKGWTL